MANKKVGRPPGRTKDRPFQMRVDDDFVAKLDNWRRQQPDFPNRTQAVRHLVDQGLAVAFFGDTAELLDRWAKTNGISRSAAVRMLIEAGLVDFASKAAGAKPRRGKKP
jgi:hypothetical protein